MPERDTGEDKTDKAEDQRLAKEALERQNQMPFFEAVRDVNYSPRKN